MYEKMLLANDGSPGAERALTAAIALARQHSAELHMISVEELPRFPASIDEIAEEREAAAHRFGGVIKHAQFLAKGTKIRFHVKSGHAVPTIVDFVKQEKFDLLILGFMGHSALYNHLIGSTTDRLVELAPCAVLVVK